MTNKSLILLVAILLMTLLASSPQAGVTKYAQAGMAFLKIDPDGQSAGMGSAATAMADNAMAMFSNPAGMGYTEGIWLCRKPRGSPILNITPSAPPIVWPTSVLLASTSFTWTMAT